ncbi:response regulator receiver domain [Leptospira idonii]|uniref:Response receiver domain-containing protein n=1 Tax=Leptospira idonii TaxID=1193500 RepID=A0A4R9LZC2_9LEPT|nr:response regulator receiver domain [Leptospira idonii]TGN19102.1 hypothetical protein EHS15_10525 [Leptospira idonii]
MMINELKRNIASHYCGSIAIIDDDVLIEDKEDSSLKVGEAFRSLIEKCSEDSILCHLHSFPKEATVTSEQSSSDKAIAAALAVAKKADVVILDWYLGLNDRPEYSLKLLNQLSESDSIRFILVYTGHSPNVEGRLLEIGFKKKENSIRVERPSASESEEPEIAGQVNEGDLPIFVKDNKIFLSFFDKAEMDSSTLIDKIYSMLYSSYPDLLHWAGFELSYRVKELFPKILPKLPVKVDKEIAIQALFKSIPNELSYQISNLILDEVKKSLLLAPVSILQDETLLSIISKEDNERIKNDKAGFLGEMKKAGKALFGNDETKKESAKTKTGLKPDTLLHLNAFIESYALSKSLDRLIQGVILQKEDKYYLSITPLCDLYRLATGGKISFLVGEESKIEKSAEDRYIQVSVISEDRQINLIFDAYNLFQIEASGDHVGYPKLDATELKDYKYVGCLREDIFNRVLHRVWVMRTRVGIDILEIVRVVRHEN